MNWKIRESDMIARLTSGAVLLPPLVIRQSHLELQRGGMRPDAVVELALPDDSTSFRFVVEAKARSTPEAVQTALAQAKAAARHDERPMVQVPYLSPERLHELERDQLSGVDLCGNGVVIVPGRLWVVRSGQPNRYRDSRPLSNPYRGRSAVVARILLTQPSWPSLGSLASSIRHAGVNLSLAQTSKAIRALQEDLLVTKTAGTITLQEPSRLLDKLAFEWRKPDIRARKAFRLPAQGAAWAARLSANPALRWTVTGESSVSRYVMFSQAGPTRLAVSDLSLASSLLGGTPEPIANYADLDLLETDESGFYFANETDDDGVRWANRLQTWLELQAGDARQREAAQDLRRQILGERQP
jgi:hypothetical protein